jgi:hypothetical protein
MCVEPGILFNPLSPPDIKKPCNKSVIPANAGIYLGSFEGLRFLSRRYCEG